MAANPAAGPLTPILEPLKAPTTIPPMMPAMSPENNGAPLAKAIPKHNGRATKKTTILAEKSFLIFYFFNQYKKDPSVTQLDMTSEDVLEGAYLVLNPFKEADGKVYTDIVEVYDADNQHVGNVQETDFAPSLKQEQPVAKVKPVTDLKLNVESTTDGLKDFVNENSAIEKKDESYIIRRLSDDKNNSFMIDGDVLRIRIPSEDFVGRPGGGTYINLSVPEGFNSDAFSEKLKSIPVKIP